MRIVCVLKSGGEYCPAQVYALRDMCLKWCPPHEFVCLTDFPALECKSVMLRHGLKGWWSKLELFDVFKTGETFFMDLDTVLRGDCGGLVRKVQGKDFVILRDFYRGAQDKLSMGSGLMFWTGSQRWIFDKFDEAGFKADLPGGDQSFLELVFREAGKVPEYWQDLTSDVCSFKAHIRDLESASNAPLVCFHGKPRPWDQTVVPHPLSRPAAPVAPAETCVVVGNGPSVKEKRMGTVIDAFSQVIRLNQFQTRGFEDFVGTRTTLYATSGRPLATTAEEKPARTLWLHGKPVWPCEESWLVPTSYYWSLVKDWSADRSILPSAGYLTVAWLLEQGVQCVHLIGFDHFKKAKSQLHHYWVPRPFKRPKEHDGDRESATFEDWVKTGQVRYL